MLDGNVLNPIESSYTHIGGPIASTAGDIKTSNTDQALKNGQAQHHCVQYKSLFILQQEIGVLEIIKLCVLESKYWICLFIYLHTLS